MMKRANLIVRSKKLDTAAKIAALATATGYPPALAAKLLEPDFCGRLGFADYQLQNIGGTITKERKRLAALTAAKTSTGAAVIAPAGETATARAGLTITATMTTPARAWKKPRPVWNVAGNLAYWRPLLVDTLGGSLYGGVVSFWEDPTDAVEQATQDAETAAKGGA